MGGAVDYFLKIEGAEGESADDKHKGEIDVLSWSWGAQQSGTMQYGGGGGAGKVQMQDFTFTMRMNKATPKLVLHCASGEHIKSAVMTARKAGKQQQEYLKLTFTDILVSSYQTGGSGDGDVVPIDSIPVISLVLPAAPNGSVTIGGGPHRYTSTSPSLRWVGSMCWVT